MATSEILKRAHKYSAEIQKRTRAQQLEWFGQQLNVPPETLLRLIGYKPTTIKQKLDDGLSVARLAEEKPDGTIWMTELFREMVSRKGYDLARVAEELQGPAPKAVEVTVPALGRKSGTAKKAVPNLLLRKIKKGGPTVFHDLTDYVRLLNTAYSTPSRVPSHKS